MTASRPSISARAAIIVRRRTSSSGSAIPASSCGRVHRARGSQSQRGQTADARELVGVLRASLELAGGAQAVQRRRR